MSALSRDEARAIVEKLDRLKGYVSPENRAKLEIQMPEVLESIDNLRGELATVTKTLTDNLFSKDTRETRFVFELIQNAEDNQYKKAAAEKKQPFLRFTVHPDRILIDSNEDGFEEVDVRAICSTGKITKNGAQAYIGENGIGFKSVFKVASKVHIQSGAFSFLFKHSQRDDGLGIVTPIFEEHHELPEGVRTRMTLTLTNPSDVESLTNEFKDLPDSSLMFLSEMEKIAIAIVKGVEDTSTTVYSYRYANHLSRGELTKHSTANGSSDKVEIYYNHITKRKSANLPTDNSRPGRHEADVVLAFPLDKDSAPLDSQQNVSAFLPIRQFQVQSNWVTQASQEDIFHPPRNEAILQGGAECSRDAVMQSRDQSTALQFQPVQCIPSKTISEPFWTKLLAKIMAILSHVSILLSRNGKAWKRPSQLKWLSRDCLDDRSEPVFEGLPEEICLSPRYRWSDKSSFDKLDVKNVSIEDTLNRVRADLTRPISRMKASTTSGSWHHWSASLLILPFPKNLVAPKSDVRKLQIIPLQNGSRTSSNEGPCEGSTETPLEDAYLPWPELLKIDGKLGVSRLLPFVVLPPELKDRPSENWDFLNKYGIRSEANLDFYLDVLFNLVHKQCPLNSEDRNVLFKVYHLVDKHSKGADDGRLRDFFADQKAIYVPARGSSEAIWAKPSQCVWEAPDFIDVRCPLAAREGYRDDEKMKRLFNSLLNIRNADWKLSIIQIGENKRRQGPYDSVADMYRHIETQILPTAELDVCVREVFEEQCLVYVPQQQAWYPPSSCLWAEQTRITSKVAIAGQYPDLENFFLHGLKVDEPDVDMLVDELKRLATIDGDPSIDKVRALIRDIDDMGPNHKDLEHLRAYNILPVQGTDGQISLKSTNDVFAIADRVEYEKLFRGRVAILAYTIEEAYTLKRFLSALGLMVRCMSRLVGETSTANFSFKEPRLTRKVRNQAYALFRCTVHYGAATPNDKRIYYKLRETEVFVSDGISKAITLSLQGTVFSVEGARSNVHIENDERQLRMYIPREFSEQLLCYLKLLPDKLVPQLGIENQEATRVIGNILNASPVILDDLLDEHGIVKLPWSDPDPYSPSEEEVFEDNAGPIDRVMSTVALDSEDPTISSTPKRESRTARLTPSPSLSTGSHTECSVDREVYTPTTQLSTGFLRTPRTSVSSIPTIGRTEAPTEERSSRSEYCGLLEHVIDAAQRAEFPRREPLSSKAVLDPEAGPPIKLSDTVFGRRSDNRIGHDVKLRAAGELYAFELLLNQDLPYFGTNNWKSTVRKEVCIHEKYASMGPRVGSKTADIIYEDEGEYKLTNLLINHGYLVGDYLKAGARIKYYLKVKTTTKECETPFHMSKAQCQRIHRTALSPDRLSTEVYIILRVFNLGQENMGIRVYVGPANLEMNGELVFEAESYTVKPAEIEEEL